MFSTVLITSRRLSRVHPKFKKNKAEELETLKESIVTKKEAVTTALGVLGAQATEKQQEEEKVRNSIDDQNKKLNDAKFQNLEKKSVDALTSLLQDINSMADVVQNLIAKGVMVRTLVLFVPNNIFIAH